MAFPSVHNARDHDAERGPNDYLEFLPAAAWLAWRSEFWFAVVVFKRTRENLRATNRFRRAACLGAAIGIAGVAVHSLRRFLVTHDCHRPRVYNLNSNRHVQTAVGQFNEPEV